MIRLLENSDLKTSAQIKSVFQISYAVEAELLKADNFPPLQRKLESYQKSDNQFFGFFIDEELAGVVEVDDKNDFTHIQSLVVHPNFFRQGVGRKLVVFVFKSFDSELFTVETGVQNLPATELYKKLGFKEVTQWETDHGVRKIRFERNI